MSLKIFFVDRDPKILGMLDSLLGEQFVVEAFNTVDACRIRLQENRPDIFLLGVDGVTGAGFDFCRSLKDDFDLQDIPVLFLSADEEIECRLACYEVGGDDFLTKPLEQLELGRKLELARRTIEEKQSLREQAGYAQRTAMSAMSSMGELGVVLQFLSKSYACDELTPLAASLLDAMRQYDLDAVVQLRAGDRCLTHSAQGSDLPMEISVLNHVRTLGRIFQFRTRCCFNFERISVLINNMPLEDVDRCGRIRDNVALLVEGADARLQALEIEYLANRRRSGIEAALPKVHAALDAVHASYRRNCFEFTRVMLDYQEELGKSFVHLGLTEDQEEHLTSTANRYLQRMVGKQDENLFIVGQLEQIARNLEGLLSRE